MRWASRRYIIFCFCVLTLNLGMLATAVLAADFTWDSSADPLEDTSGNRALGGSPTPSISGSDDNVFVASDFLTPSAGNEFAIRDGADASLLDVFDQVKFLSTAVVLFGGLAMLGRRGRRAHRSRRCRAHRTRSSRPRRPTQARIPRAATLQLALLVALIFNASTTEAGTILQPVTVATDMGTLTSPFDLQFIRDQSGLSAGYTNLVDDFDTYLATGPTHGPIANTVWMSGIPNETGNVDFSLGGEFTIGSVALWNLPHDPGSLPGDSGVNAFELYADTNSSFTSPVFLGSLSANENLTDTVLAEVFTFPTTAATHVRMTILSNHGGTVVSATGLSEVAFEVVPLQSLVPEPAAVVLMALGGLALLCFRRRASKPCSTSSGGLQHALPL